jgi:hypothetical protein
VGECTAEEELMTDAHVMDHVLQTAVQNAVMKTSQLLLMVEWNQSLGYLRGFFWVQGFSGVLCLRVLFQV